MVEYTDVFIEATLFEGWGMVDITDRLLLNTESLVSEATRNSLRD